MKSDVLRITASVIAILLSISQLTAQTSWTRMPGPYGGRVNAVIARPADEALFAGTYPSYIFRSTDLGSTWTQLRNGLGNTGWFCFAIDSSGNIYAGGYGGVQKSTDSGDSWLTTGSPYKKMNGLTIDHDGRIFAASIDRILRSTDAGTNFQAVGLPGVNVLAILAAGSGTVFAGTGSNGVYKSTDHGDTWAPCNNGMPVTGIFSLAEVPGSGDLLLSSDHIYRSTDDGASWSVVSLTAPAGGLVVQHSTGYWFSMSAFGIYRSTDAGATWTEKKDGINVRRFGGGTVTASGKIFACGDGGVYKSINNGGSWTPMNRGLINTSIHVLARNNSDILFAGTEGSGLYRSSDLGQSWTSLAQYDIDPNAMSVVVVNPGITDPQLLMGTLSGLYYSSDGGYTWSAVTNGVPPAADCRSLFLTPQGMVFLGTFEQGMYRSSDDGASWTKLTTGLIDSTFLSFAVNQGTADVLAGSRHQGVFYTHDEGNTWSQRNTGIMDELKVNILRFNVATQTWYAGTGSDSLYQSTDNGGHWTDVSHGAVMHETTGMETKADGELFLSTRNGILRSPDNGATWLSFGSGLGYSDVKCLLKGNLKPFLWAGTPGWGVYRTTHYVPLELLSFTARRAGGEVELHWKTAGEANTRLFEVQRAPGDRGTSSWEKIGSITPAGIAEVENVYAYADRLPPVGSILYRIRVVENDGSDSYSPVEEVPAEGALTLALLGNYPNPVSRGKTGSSGTSILYTLDRPLFVSLRIFDLLGREAEHPVEGMEPAGSGSVRLDAGRLAPGAYFIRMTAGGRTFTRRMTVVE